MQSRLLALGSGLQLNLGAAGSLVRMLIDCFVKNSDACEYIELELRS